MISLKTRGFGLPILVGGARASAGNSSNAVGDQLKNSVNKAERLTFWNKLDIDVNFDLLHTVCYVFCPRQNFLSPTGHEGASFVSAQVWCRELWMWLNANSGAWGHIWEADHDALGVLQRR